MEPTTVSPPLEQVLHDLNRRFGWDDPDTRFSLVERREGRNSTIALFATDRGDQIVVKDGRGHWDSHSAGDVASAMSDAARALDGRGTAAVRAPAPFAWTETPKLVVSRYIDGVDLTELFRSREHPMWTEPPGALEEWLGATGSALADYHRNADVEPDAYQQAVRCLEATARKALVRPAMARRLTPAPTEQVHARSYIDPNPSNWRRARDGTIWLLDPPVETRFDFVHRDVAQFLTRSERVLRANDQVDRYPLVREAFLAGYDGFGSTQHARRDLALVSLYEARFYLGAARIALRTSLARVPRQLTKVWRCRSAALHP